MTIRPFAAALLALAAPLAAQDFSGLKEPINPDRPDFTNGPALVAPGHLQIETGYTYARTGSEKASSLGEVLLRYAFDDRWEARLGLNSYDWIDSGVRGEPRISGLEDPFAEVKIRLNDAEAEHRPHGVPAMGLLLNTTIPLGARALTADAWQPTATLALGWELSDVWSLDGNLGYTYAADGGRRFDQLFASVSAGFTINPRWSGFLEGFIFSRESADGPATHYADTGLFYQVSNDLALDVRIGAGLDKPRPNWFTGLGASVRF
ncbi:MAG TPA: transporter [Thermoanaerobaculia bacterium]|nr:transporter [Thermoanaerobaculia bacterium]